MTADNRPPTSFRFSKEALELLDAIAAYRGSKRVGVLERLLAGYKPPDAVGPDEAAIRRAHTNFLKSRGNRA